MLSTVHSWLIVIVGTAFEKCRMNLFNYFKIKFNFMKKNKILTLSLIAAASLFVSTTLISCSKDDDSTGGGSGSGTASTTFKVTDAPIDDAGVTGAFVTISDIKVDGQSVSGYTKQTVDLMAYQNGSTKTLGTFNLNGKTYSNVTFVLDFNTDASGNAPGSYVVTTGNVKHKLETTSNVITVTKPFTLTGGTAASLVADFDLRKMIVAQTGGGADMYNFATSAELQNDVRIVTESNSGRISGTITDAVSGSTRIVAYAYKKGTYVRSTEVSAQGASNVYFSNAVASTMATSAGVGSFNYNLSFLEPGEYEIHFASYKDTNADGVYEFQGTLNATSALDLNNLVVSGALTLSANATVTGVTP
jgi:hypothetical protein